MSTNDGPRRLWQNVLMVVIEDAVNGCRDPDIHKDYRVRATLEAREFLTTDSRDFRLLCDLAGFNPDSLQEKLVALIATAKPPEEALAVKRPVAVFGNKHIGERKSCAVEPQAQEPVQQDRATPGLSAVSGTGAGSDTQERTKIGFSLEEQVR